MTDEEIGRLTIAEIEAIVARATDALAKFAEAKALLSGSPVMTINPIATVNPAHFINRRPPSTKGVELTAEERAQRDMLVAQSRGVGLSEEEEAEMLARAAS